MLDDIVKMVGKLRVRVGVSRSEARAHWAVCDV